MICILFPPGGFGSTIEYCIREFSLEFDSINAEVSADGSMHDFKKQYHPSLLYEYQSIKDCTEDIITPVYPNFQTTPLECVELVISQLKKDDKVIFVTFPDLYQSERNFFFAYHKIYVYKNSMFRKINELKVYKNWNSKYNSAADMQIWEQREVLAMEFDQTFVNHIVPKNIVGNDCLCITPSDILDNFESTIRKIMEFLNLTFVDANFIDFKNKWLDKQKYILNGHSLVENIVHNTISNKEFCWDKLDLAYEAFVQYRLKRMGFDLRCFDLNTFPTNSLELHKLLDQL